MPTLRELGDRWEELDAALAASEGEITPEMEAMLGLNGEQVKEKVDAYAFRIKALTEQAKGIKKMSDDLAARSRALDNQVSWLKERMLEFMQRTRQEALKGEVWRIQRQMRKTSSVEIESFDAIPEVYLTRTVSADKKALAQAIKEGLGMPGVRLVENTSEHVRIY